MPLDDFEREVLRRFRGVLRSALRRNIGRFTEQDAGGPDRLRVDATFDETAPALAVEVTAIRDSIHWKTAGSLDRALSGLEEIVSRERLGAFEIAVRGDADLAGLAHSLPPLLRNMADGQHPSFRLAEDDPLSVKGLLSISRLQTGENVVRAGVMSHADFGSIDSDLRDTIAANRSKLGEARVQGRETHLVVVVEPHRSPEGAAVPELPPEVDFLWLFLQFEPWLKDRYVWWIRRLGRRWQTAPRW